MAQGLFVGLVTLDLLYLTQHLPDRNQKIVALDYILAAGGPATNAAITFQFLGHQATLAGSLGHHALAQLIRADLAQHSLQVTDLTPHRSDPPPTSSILVTQGTGDRAVVSLNAVQVQAPAHSLPEDLLSKVDIVLLDGHQQAVGHRVAQWARANQIPVVLDGGSWKPGLEQILPEVDYALCSANFFPPQCHTVDEVFAYLGQYAIPYIAITRGAEPILACTGGADRQEVVVPLVQPVVDTLGAGDIFHGAFCHAILQSSWMEALGTAAGVAARSCQFLGTRQWMTHPEALSQLI